MLIYDKKTRTLTTRIMDDLEYPLNPLDAQLASYKKFRTKTIHDIVDYFIARAKEEFGIQYLKASNVNVKLHVSSTTGFINAYYEVIVTLNVDGIDREPYLFLNIPYMDNYGLLSVKGKPKVLQCELRSAECVSFDREKSIMSISLPKRNISITYKSNAGGSGITVRYGKENVPIVDILRGYAVELGLPIDISEQYANGRLRVMLHTDPALSPVTVQADMRKRGILQKYKDAAYSLGATREALNSLLSLDRAVGRTLSRPVYNINNTIVLANKGDVVTPSMLKEFKRNLVNTIYVQSIPNINDLVLAHTYTLSYFPAGTEVTDIIAEMLDNLREKDPTIPKGWAILPYDIHLDMSNIITLNEGTKVTEDVLRTIHSSADSVACKKKVSFLNANGKRQMDFEPVTISFETEIMSNRMLRYNEVLNPTDYEAKGVKGTDWVYTYDNPTLEVTDNDKLTYHDWCALTSILMATIEESATVLHNRDHAFLKKLDMADDLFANALYTVIDTNLLVKHRKNLEKVLRGTKDYNPFLDMTTIWLKTLRDNKHLTDADPTNVVEVISEATHACILTKAEKPPEALRQLALPYMGRIDPYETPAGKRLGLTNTLAMGARVRSEDGLILTAYRKVVKTELAGKGVSYRLADRITWMTPIDEIHGNEGSPFKFGCLMDLSFNSDGTLQNKLTYARIPNIDMLSDEPMVVDTIHTFDLDYVTAFTEQHLAFSTSMMPFASANEASRVTFGLSMIRQSLPIVYSHKPSVTTQAYYDIYSKYSYAEHEGSPEMYLNTQCVIARKSGTVIDIGRGYISVIYDDAEVETINFSEVMTTHYATTLMSIRVDVNEHFEKGQELASTSLADDGCYAPARDCLVAYVITGYNYEDGVHSSTQASANYISLRTVHIEHAAMTKNTLYKYQGAEAGYRYINDHQKIAALIKHDITSGTEDIVEWNSGDNEGIFCNYRILHDMKNHSGNKMIVDLISFNRLDKSDKVAGRHGNKGVVTISDDNSNMPLLENGLPVEICENPLGVSSRMNIGQILEANLSLVAHILNINIKANAFNGISTHDIQMLLEFTWTLANTDNIENKSYFDTVASLFPDVPEDLKDDCYDVIDKILDWKGAFNPDGTAHLFNPKTGKYYVNDILIGYPHILKLRQEGDTKMGLRGGLFDQEPYTVSSLQPTQGGKRHGGQSDGEMEVVTMAAHNAVHALQEMMTAKSDALGAASNLACDVVPELVEHRVDDDCTYPRSLFDFQYYMEALGVCIEETTTKNKRPIFPDITRQGIQQQEYVDPVAAIYEESDAVDQITDHATVIEPNSLSIESQDWKLGD